MVRCKDCKHFRTGNIVKEPWGHCGKTWSDRNDPDDDKSKAYVHEGHGYWAFLW